MCAPWFGKFLKVFENVLEVISDHIMNESNLESFPKAKKIQHHKSASPSGSSFKCHMEMTYIQGWATDRSQNLGVNA